MSTYVRTTIYGTYQNGTRVQILHYLKNNLKYKHSGATGTLASGRCQHRRHHGTYLRGPSPQDVALRGVMQALVRIQAYCIHARRHCSGDSRGKPRHRGSGVRAVAKV
jgi:hypothetical protein